MVGPLGEGVGELEEQVVGGGGVDKQVAGAGARGTGRGDKCGEEK